VRFLFSNCVYIGIKRQRRGGGNTNDRNNMNVVYNNKKTNFQIAHPPPLSLSLSLSL
jgi:hypothetical protein